MARSVRGAAAHAYTRQGLRGSFTATEHRRSSSVHLHRKAPALLSVVALVAATAALGVSSAAASDRAVAGSGKSPGPKVVRLQSTDNKTKLSDTKFRPGVTEFKVTKTAGSHESIVVFQSKNLQRTFKKADKAFGGGP